MSFRHTKLCFCLRSSRSKSNASAVSYLLLFFSFLFSMLWSKECFMVPKYTHSHIHGQSWTELISQWFGPVDMSWRGRYNRNLLLCRISVPPPPPTPPRPLPQPRPPRAPASPRPLPLVLCHWRELPQVWFLSRQKFCCNKHVFCRDKKYVFCCDKTRVCRNKTFLLSRQNTCLSQQNFCRDKHHTSGSSRQW